MEVATLLNGSLRRNQDCPRFVRVARSTRADSRRRQDGPHGPKTARADSQGLVARVTLSPMVVHPRPCCHSVDRARRRVHHEALEEPVDAI